MTSPAPIPLQQVVTAHGRELAVIRNLLEEAARDTIILHSPRGRFPKGTPFSSLTREKLLQLVEECEGLAGTGVAVLACGEDWVRIWLPNPGWMLKLLSRPKLIMVDDEAPLFELELGGVPRGYPIMFWRFNMAEDRLAHFTIARVRDLDWKTKRQAEVIEEIEITGTLATLAPASTATVPGTGNDDDDLRDVVGRWDSTEALSEAEATDTIHKDSHDDERDAAVGEDDN